MRLLLDTHIFLWGLLEPERLTANVVSEIESSSNEIWLSPISLWETLVLAEKGRVVLAPDSIAWLRHVLRTVSFKEAHLNHEIAVQSRIIELAHQDPADRFLTATALVYNLTLVTADARLLASKQIATLANI